jgi:aerobic C4-dicarboxylate transport protein
VALEPLGDGFLQLIKMMIAPVIFCTVVHGIASTSDCKKVGQVASRRGSISRWCRRSR